MSKLAPLLPEGSPLVLPDDAFILERAVEPVMGWDSVERDRTPAELPRSVALLEDGTLVVQARFATAFVPPRGQPVAFATAGLRLLAADTGGRRLLFRHEETVAHAVWDRARQAFVPPSRVFPAGWMWEEHEVATLVDVRAGVARQLHALTRYPNLYVTSPDTRWLWLQDKDDNGGIFEVRTGCCVWDRPVDALEPARVPRLDVGPTAARGSRRALAFFAARAERRWRLYVDGVLFAGREPAWRIPLPSVAAAFDRAGERLVLVAPDRAVVLDVRGTPRVARVVSLAPLRELVSFRPLGRLPRTRVVRLGYRHGTRDLVPAADA